MKIINVHSFFSVINLSLIGLSLASCGNNGKTYEVGNSNGTNWSGYISGILYVEVLDEDSGTCHIVHSDDYTASNLRIPEKVVIGDKKYLLTEIGWYGFASFTLQSLYIPPCLKYIDEFAFNEDSLTPLPKIIFPSDIQIGGAGGQQNIQKCFRNCIISEFEFYGEFSNNREASWGLELFNNNPITDGIISGQDSAKWLALLKANGHAMSFANWTNV